MNVVGWLGAAMLAMCGLPQAWRVYRTGQTRDLSWWFLGLWAGGEACCLTYVLHDNIVSGSMQWPLLANYGACIAVVLYLLARKADNR